MIFICHTPTAAIADGFLPAAKSLGLEVVILTDQPQAYQDYSQQVLACDVFHPGAILDCIYRHHLPVQGIFSNSDHLQYSTALAAQFYGLPHKSPRATYLAKNKAALRAELERLGIETLWHQTLADLGEVEKAEGLRFPAVVKPVKGVASLHVKYIESQTDLVNFASAYWEKNPGLSLLLEEYLAGPIHSVETLGDAHQCRILGGFRCSLSPLPFFIETGARWGVPRHEADYVLTILTALGATFGACHTEIVATPQGPKIIEINYRCIGDHSDFQLNNLMGGTYFEKVLRIHLGENLGETEIAPQLYSSTRYLFAQRAGTLQAIPQAWIREREGCRVHYIPTRKANESIALSHSNKDYLAVVHATGTGETHVETVLARELAAIEAQIQWQ